MNEDKTCAQRIWRRAMLAIVLGLPLFTLLLAISLAFCWVISALTQMLGG